MSDWNVIRENFHTKQRDRETETETERGMNGALAVLSVNPESERLDGVLITVGDSLQDKNHSICKRNQAAGLYTR